MTGPDNLSSGAPLPIFTLNLLFRDELSVHLNDPSRVGVCPGSWGAFRLTMPRGSENPAVHAEGTQSAAASAVAAARRRASTRDLGPVARAIAAGPISHAISPVVLIGFVQAIEFLLMVAARGAVYPYTAYPGGGFDR